MSGARYLAENTDAVNLSAYSYQFDVEHVTGDVHYINLKKPWTKKRRKK